MKYIRFVFAACCLSVLFQGDAATTQLRLIQQVPDQSNEGFQLRLEGRSQGAVCRLEDSKLLLLVGNGKRFDRLTVLDNVELNKDYHVIAEITSQGVDVMLNGETAGHASIQMTLSDREPVKVNNMPGWLRARTDFLVVTKRVELKNGPDNSRLFDFSKEASRPLRLLVLEPYPKDLFEWEWDSSKPLVIEADFSVIPHPTVEDVAPLVDRYGQAVAAEYEDKIKTDEELSMRLGDEQKRLQEMGPAKPTGYDPYGGNLTLGWSETGTGFFRTLRRDGMWWLISPEGNPLFYSGLDTMPGFVQPPTMVQGREALFEEVPPKTGVYAEAWIRKDDSQEMLVPHVANLIRKFGEENWKKGALELMASRLDAWGFSGTGKWCADMPEMVENGLPKPYPWLGQPKISTTPKVGDFVDVFNPESRRLLEAELRIQMEAHVNDPWLLGWSIGNERHQIVLMEKLNAMLNAPAGTPVKEALYTFATTNLYGGDSAKRDAAWKDGIPDADHEALRQFFARSYYEFIYRTVKEIDPNHLYFGFWPVPGWWVSDEDWRMLSANCDVIGYDRYNKVFAPDWLSALMKESDKPVLVGEFGFPPFYHGQRGVGQFKVSADDDADAAMWAGFYIREAAENPYCIGVMWFHYRDQPITGRDGDLSKGFIPGEHFAFGVVDVTDTPKWDLVEGYRKINQSVDTWRQNAAEQIR